MTDDVTALTQLVLHERQGRDREWWDAMLESYAPDAEVRLSWFRGSGAEFVDQSRRMAGRGDRAVHRLGPAVVDVHGGRALVELPAVIEVTTELDGVEAVLASYARLLHRAVRTGNGWRIASLDPLYERDTLTPGIPGSTVRVDEEELRKYRVPYRFLAYVLGRRGYGVGDDLYGDDRPDEVARVYAEAHHWLNPAGRKP
ncbi:nuclear transport factor 2 family protein [Streptomyces sp. NPDC057757]|uniref:nuclear transport factor 2 family protein n=1 Tax=Streptomyces sp. NPDC057757 TaxID=3346241 RepID=UPI0036989C26